MESTPSGEDQSHIYHLVDLNTEQIRALDRDKTVAVIPGGILEEHRPYLPCYTDGYEAGPVVDDLVGAIAGRPGWSVLVFPTIPLGAGGANGIGGKYSFPGSYTVRAKTLRAVYMDLASELGEQGFRWVFPMSLHGAPEHNRALHQACAYFTDTYGGRMVHLFGLMTLSGLVDLLFVPDESAREAAGFDIHAGTGETSWMLFVRPDLVDPAYAQAAPWAGKDWNELRRIAAAPDWPGYFGAPALARAAYGKYSAEACATFVQTAAFGVLDGEDADATARNDHTPLQDGPLGGRKQKEWLEKNGLG